MILADKTIRELIEEGELVIDPFSLPIKLQKGRRICQLVFCRMDQATDKPYRGKYQGQRRSVGSRVFQDEEARENTKKLNVS